MWVVYSFYRRNTVKYKLILILKPSAIIFSLSCVIDLFVTLNKVQYAYCQSYFFMFSK
jgi:hypothetical protein